MTEVRHTVDTITDDALDALYDRIAELEKQTNTDVQVMEKADQETDALADVMRRYKTWGEQQHERAEAATRVGIRYMIAAERYEAAWRSARHRAAVLSSEVTRRAPLLGQSQAALARVHALATQWAVLRTYGSAATELRTALAEPTEPTT
jgi:hypothetical protein